MRFTILAISILTITISGAPAGAATDPNTVQFLRDACREEVAAGTSHYCLGFVEGAGQMMTVNGFSHYPLFAMCPAEERAPTGGAMIQAFLNWSDKHPEKWGGNALVGVGLALAEAWPCVKSK